MGDIADFHLESYYGDHEHDEEREVRCKHCGERGLFWEQRGVDRFILVDEDGRAHAPHCKGKVAQDNEFTNLDEEGVS